MFTRAEPAPYCINSSFGRVTVKSWVQRLYFANTCRWFLVGFRLAEFRIRSVRDPRPRRDVKL